MENSGTKQVSSPGRRVHYRLGAVMIGSIALVIGVLSVPASDQAASDATTMALSVEAEKMAQGLPHQDLPGMPDHSHDAAHGHDHSDPATKNALARGADAKNSVDPTTASQRAANADYVEEERNRPDPRLVPASLKRVQKFIPRNKYEMAGGCYTLRAPDGRYVLRNKQTLKLRDIPRRKSTRFRFKATSLGKYMLYLRSERYLSAKNGRSYLANEPSNAAEWAIFKVKGKFRLKVRTGRFLRAPGKSVKISNTPMGWRIEKVKGCKGFPESEVDIIGRPHAGASDIQEVRGYVDAHTHGMAFEFLGGEVHCGQPWHKFGVEYALKDCEDHTNTGGKGAALEAALSGEPTHDPVGWPTFKDWPAPNSLTHEGTYYRWMERSWRGGQRLFVNLLVENNQLCQIYPLKRNSCDDMDSVRLQARQMYRFQNYIDAQFGGPGKGFYRIVKSPWEARKVINQGKMAVVMGIETSVPFGCTFKQVGPTDVPECTKADIDRQLDEMKAMGVRQMELVNKFDNALGGVAGDTGETGVAVNSANFLETGTFWDMRSCDPPDGESSDRSQLAAPDISAGQQDALFGAINKIFGTTAPAIPLYGPPLHCNERGLTELGKHTIQGLAKRQMIFDPDHLSEKARQGALDVIEGMDYPGIISSHSWSTPATYPRIYESGGFITPYAGDSTGFVEKWEKHLGWADPRYYFGFGFGADINGLGAQGDPRGAGVSNPVTYPFAGLGGVIVKKQRAGQRVYDINKDGVAQYGLYPDWIEDLRKVAGGEKGEQIVDDMTRGPEAYLQMWERSQGIPADSCRNPELRKNRDQVRQLVKPGMSTVAVMRAIGQPFERRGLRFRTCAKQADGSGSPVEIDFNDRGRVVEVRA